MPSGPDGQSTRSSQMPSRPTLTDTNRVMVDPMPNQHRYRPISIRLPEASRLWLLAFAERTEQPLNQILTEAVTDWLNTNDDAPPALPPPPGDRLIVNPHTAAALERDGRVREQDFVVSEPVPAPPKPRKKRKAAPVAAELARADGCSHPASRVHKGMCGACGTGGLT